MRNQFEVATCPLAGNDAGQAGRRVVAEAFGRLEGGKADAVLLFAGSGADLPQLLAGAKAAAGPAPVVGCTTAGEIGPLGLQKGTVVAAALRFPGHRMVAAAAPQVGLDARAAGRRLADDIVRAVGAHSLRGTLLLFADGLTCDGMALVDAIYDELGPGVHVMGG